MRRYVFCIFLTITFLVLSDSIRAQLFRPVKGWPKEVNDRLEEFLNTTLVVTGRKVAVFDGDGTTFGQVPFYLADEALYQYADEVLKKRNDEDARQRLAILDKMVKDGNNVGKPYVENRIHFLAGLTPREIENMGTECFQQSYRGKFYPEMKILISNLKEYGFEVWILTASPEQLYQKFFSEELGISPVQVVGAKCVIREGKTTHEIIPPIPQDDGKAHTIETFIKAKPLIVGGNSRGDLDMLNESAGLKIVVNPDDVAVRGPEDGPMSGHTVKSYWEKEGALIVKCNDVADPDIRFHTEKWKIKPNIPHPK